MLTGGGDGGRRSESKRTMDDGSLQVGVFTGGGDLSASSDGKRCRACGSASCTSKRWRRLGWAGSSYRARPGDCAPEQRDEERWGLNGDDLQTCTGTAKPNDIDEANATVCSPSAREEWWRRKGWPKLGKTTESMSDSRERPHHGVEFDKGNSRMVSVCTGSAQFRRESSL
jgi:hypothetical protein